MTGNPGHTIKGNITITTGAVLAFNPSSTGTVFLAGNSNQIISNSGSLSFGSNSIIAINNNAGITIANDISMNNLSLTGIVTTSGTSILVLNGALSGGSSSSIFLADLHKYTLVLVQKPSQLAKMATTGRS